MRRCGATSRPRMSATPRRSCSRTWRRRLPARSSTSTAASATWWPAFLLLRRQTPRPDLDIGAAAQAFDESLVLRIAVKAGGAHRGLRIGLLGSLVDHSRHAQQDVAGVGQRDAEISRQLGGIGAEHLAHHVGRKALRLAARDQARRAPLHAGVLALAQLLELRRAFLEGERGRLAVAQQLGNVALYLVQLALRRRLVLEHPRRDQRVRRDLDGVGIALVLQRVGGEQRRQQLRVVERAELLARRLGDPAGGLDRQLEALGGAFQAVRLLVHHVAEGLGGFGELALPFLARDLVGDLLLHLFVRARLARLDAGEAQDVEAELALHHLHLVLPQLERRLLEGLHHHAAAEPAEVAALLRRAGVLRVFFRELRKAIRRLAHLVQELFRLVLGLHQDVAGAALLLHAQLVGARSEE